MSLSKIAISEANGLCARARAQAFSGRAAECILEALSAAQAKCCLLSLNSMIFPYYLAMTLNSPHCYQLSQEYTHGTGNHDLGLTRMVKITLPLPPLAEQKRIVSKLEEILPLCDKLKS